MYFIFGSLKSFVSPLVLLLGEQLYHFRLHLRTGYLFPQVLDFENKICNSFSARFRATSLPLEQDSDKWSIPIQSSGDQPQLQLKSQLEHALEATI